MEYGMKLYDNKADETEITFIWETEDENFNNEFCTILQKFLNECKGSIEIDGAKKKFNN